MKFLEYTKQLAQQIAYYDTITKNKINPFNKPVQITIVWVDEKEN